MPATMAEAEDLIIALRCEIAALTKNYADASGSAVRSWERVADMEATLRNHLKAWPPRGRKPVTHAKKRRRRR